MRRMTGGMAAITAMLASVMVVGTTAAGQLDTWSGTTLRNATGAALQDADFNGQDVAVVWSEPGPELWFRRSMDAGNGFDPRYRIATQAREAEVEICSRDVYVAYARKSAGEWRIRAKVFDIDPFANVVSMPVSIGGDRARDPDLTCAGGRLFVSWLQRVGDDYHIMVDHTLRAGGTFDGTTKVDFGPSEPGLGQPVLAGVGNRAYMAEQSEPGGPITFHRWSVGSSPGYPVQYLGANQIAGSGWDPVIGAAGDTVVVDWSAYGALGNVLRVRVSHDRGATWGPTRKAAPSQGGIEDAWFTARSVAVRGSRIVLAYALVGCSFEPGGGCSTSEYLLSTKSDFVNSTRTPLADNSGELVVGLVVKQDGPHLAAAIDRGPRIRFLLKD